MSYHAPKPRVPSRLSSSWRKHQTEWAWSTECQDPDVFSPQGPDSPILLPDKHIGETLLNLQQHGIKCVFANVLLEIYIPFCYLIPRISLPYHFEGAIPKFE